VKRALLALLAAGCPAPATKPQEPLKDTITVGEGDPRTQMIAQIQDDVLEAYERDDPPELRTDLVDAKIGGARVGVAPTDILVGDELSRAGSRWPLAVDRDTAEARSKRLEIHLAQDTSAAWTFDEVSWRIKMCGRVAVIPLRITSLYAHDGDRWVPVVEHVSFARQPVQTREGALVGTPVKSAVVSRDIADDLSGALNPVLSGAIRDPNVLSASPDALLLGPDVAAEWHGPATLDARLVELAKDGKLAREDRRIGTIGRTTGTASIAYWVGNLVADLPARPGLRAGKVRLRGTFVFEKRKITTNTLGPPDAQGKVKVVSTTSTDRWVLVQGHVSAPISDQDLATLVFGTSLVALDPLRVTCDDGSPAAVPSPKAPPAAR
jgi:hypothetical protein